MRVGQYEVAVGVVAASVGKQVGFLETVGQETLTAAEHEVGENTLDYLFVPAFVAEKRRRADGTEKQTGVVVVIVYIVVGLGPADEAVGIAFRVFFLAVYEVVAVEDVVEQAF